MNKFLNEFIDRGFFYQCTNKEELSNILINRGYKMALFLSPVHEKIKEELKSRMDLSKDRDHKGIYARMEFL